MDIRFICDIGNRETRPRALSRGSLRSLLVLDADDHPIGLDGFHQCVEERLCRRGATATVTLGEARSLLLGRSTSPEMRDRMRSEIVTASRTDGDEWKTVTVAMALPGLINLARQFACDYAETGYEDLCAEVAAAFLAALQSVDVQRPAILTRIYWAAYRAIRRSAYAEVFAAAS